MVSSPTYTITIMLEKGILRARHLKYLGTKDLIHRKKSRQEGY